LHVLRRDGLVDRDFIQTHTFGWDELEPLLHGCTPAGVKLPLACPRA
jgi:hypothetical protein